MNCFHSKWSWDAGCEKLSFLRKKSEFAQLEINHVLQQSTGADQTKRRPPLDIDYGGWVQRCIVDFVLPYYIQNADIFTTGQSVVLFNHIGTLNDLRRSPWNFVCEWNSFFYLLPVIFQEIRLQSTKFKIKQEKQRKQNKTEDIQYSRVWNRHRAVNKRRAWKICQNE